MTIGDKRKFMSDETLPEQESVLNDAGETKAQEDGMAELVEQDEMEALQLKIDELQVKADEYLDGWQRARAEFANYKKRVEREQATVYQTAMGNVLKRFLEIIDDLERALKNRPNQDNVAEWISGIELVYRKFFNVLEAEGVKLMDAEGKEFDPNQHEAISHEELEGEASGKIIEVVKQGYLLGDRVLRPAGVRVAK